jgi:pimeloyl-ACP methyl ester carboxylesterase
MEMQSKVTGKGEPLVLVPGGLTGWLSWEPHAERLSATRKVVRTQLLNLQYGLENRPLPTDYSVKTESRVLETTLDKLGMRMPLDLVAWSYGAAVTLDYALGHPERVRSLTLIEPPALWVLRTQGLLDAEAKENIAILQTLSGDISELQLEQFMKTVGLTPPGKSAREMAQWPLFVQHRQSLRNSPAVVQHEGDPQRLRDFKRSVLLVKGTGSARFLHQIIDALATMLPDTQVVEMPAGHAPHVVSMDRFLERLAIFQARVNS